MTFRELRADEIECRVSTVNDKGCSLLLYKDARVDQNILDETFGMANWQRNHELIDGQLFCNVGVRVTHDDGVTEWIWKQDVGVESYTEKEKGRASDAFKRACFNLGIGRELYTAPFIWIGANDVNIFKGSNGKPTTRDRFSVDSIAYDENRRIKDLRITKKGKIVWSFGSQNIQEEESQNIQEEESQNIQKKEAQKISEAKVNALKERCRHDGVPEGRIAKLYKVSDFTELKEKQYSNINKFWESIKGMSD